MKNKEEVLNLIQIAKNLESVQPHNGEDPEYYIGFIDGKSATVDSILKRIEYIVKNEEVEF